MASDYKTKYLDLRAKYLESTDVAFRLGYEKGLKDGYEHAKKEQAEQSDGVDEEFIELLTFAIAYPNDVGKMRMRGMLVKAKQLLTRQPVQVDEEMIEVLDSVIERYRTDCPSPVKVTLEALARIKQLLQQKPQIDVEKLADKLVNLSLSIVEQSGDTQRFLKAKRFIEDNLTQKRTVTTKDIHDFVDREWQDGEYGYPESYEVKGMIADFMEKELGIEVK